MAVRYKRELVRQWVGASKEGFDSLTNLKKKTLTFDEVALCAWVFQSPLQGRDKNVVNFTKRVGLVRDADEPCVLPTKRPLSKLFAGDVRGVRSDAIIEANKFFRHLRSGVEPDPRVVKAPKPPKDPPKAIASKVARGVALVEQAIAALPGKKPVSAAVRKKLTLDGKKLPPSLARWLEHDSSRVECFAKNKLQKTSLVALCKTLGVDIEPTEDPLREGSCYLLMEGAEMVQFLYVGRADAIGEYPVLTLDVDDAPAVLLQAPGFDVWIAQLSGAIEDGECYGDVPKGYAPFMKEAARLNLGGARELDL